MNRSLTKFFTPVLFIFCFFIFTTKANACSCSPIITVTGDKTKSEDKIKQELNEFEGAIFEGKVIKIETSEKYKKEIKVTFEVKKYWKGTSAKEITVSTFSKEGICGVPFNLGKTYFVAARGNENNLSTYLCLWTKFTSYKELYPKYLGKSKKPE